MLRKETKDIELTNPNEGKSKDMGYKTSSKKNKFTLFDAITILGTAFDIKHIVLNEPAAFDDELQKKILMYTFVLEFCVNAYIEKLPEPSQINPVTYEINDEKLEKKLNNVKTLNAIRASNKNAGAAYTARKAIGELLQTEAIFVDACENIGKNIPRLKEILSSYPNTISTNEFLDWNQFLKDYFKIKNTLSIGLDEILSARENVFAFLPILEKRIFSADFLSCFEAQENIVRKYNKFLNEGVNNLLDLPNVTEEHKKFLKDMQQSSLITPVQRTMRYALTLKEIHKSITILFDAGLYQPISVLGGELPKEIAAAILPKLLQMLEIRMRNINIEEHLRNIIAIVQENKSKYEIRINSLKPEFMKTNAFDKYCFLNALETRLNRILENKSYTDKDCVSQAINEVKREFPIRTNNLPFFKPKHKIDKLVAELQVMFEACHSAAAASAQLKMHGHR